MSALPTNSDADFRQEILAKEIEYFKYRHNLSARQGKELDNLLDQAVTEAKIELIESLDPSPMGINGNAEEAFDNWRSATLKELTDQSTNDTEGKAL